jgi:hypothetical protein
VREWKGAAENAVIFTEPTGNDGYVLPRDLWEKRLMSPSNHPQYDSFLAAFPAPQAILDNSSRLFQMLSGRWTDLQARYSAPPFAF